MRSERAAFSICQDLRRVVYLLDPGGLAVLKISNFSLSQHLPHVQPRLGLTGF